MFLTMPSQSASSPWERLMRAMVMPLSAILAINCISWAASSGMVTMISWVLKSGGRLKRRLLCLRIRDLLCSNPRIVGAFRSGQGSPTSK